MKQDLQQIRYTIGEIVNREFVVLLEEKLQDHQELMRDTANSLDEYHRDLINDQSTDARKYIEKTIELIPVVAKNVDKIGNQINKDEFDYLVNPLKAAIESFIQTLEPHHIDIQNDKRFISSGYDSLYIKIGKLIKRIGFRITQWPIQAGNLFRRMLGKPLKPIKSWTHKIPFQNLSLFYLRDELSRTLLPIGEVVLKIIVSTAKEFWILEEQIYKNANELILASEEKNFQIAELKATPYRAHIEKVSAMMNDSSKLFSQNIGGIIDEIFIKYADAYEKAGTFELPASKLTAARLENSQQAVKKIYEIRTNGWSNTLNTLTDGWKLDQELYLLGFISWQQLLLMQQRLSSKITQKIAPHLTELSSFLNEMLGKIQSTPSHRTELRKLLTSERKSSVAHLRSKLIPECLQSLFNQDLPIVLDKLENEIKENTGKLSERRAVVKDSKFDGVTKNSDISYIAPQELITFEALPNLVRVIVKAKSDLVQKIREIEFNVRDLEQITDFNLGAALQALSEKSETQSDAKEVATEGLKRAISKVKDIKDTLDELGNSTISTINDSIKVYNSNLIELTEIENVFEVNVRIAKAKAIERTRAFKQKAVDYVRNVIPMILVFSRQKTTQFMQFYERTRKRYGITSGRQDLTAEVSNLLASAQEAISRLPYVYRKLFEVEPLQDQSFYQKRDVETMELKRAYDSWIQGNFSPTIIAGEAGSGTTTLVNMFLLELNSPIKQVTTDESTKIYAGKDFISLIKSWFDIEKAEDLEQIIGLLNKLTNKRIAVVENLQHFFIRKVDGFSCLRMFVELISRTNKNIFWIVTINQYSFEYLNKTMQIGEHFGYTVKLSDLKADQISEIILKRHRVSGYNIKFQPSELDLVNKKYQKMSDADQQKYLSDEYFSGLNKLAKNNISLALIYWLRSALEVHGDVITMGSLKDLDFTFLSSLSAPKVFTLHMLLIHNGLTVEEHAQVFDQYAEQSKLLLMLLHDDGIVVRKNGSHLVNPLLYRPVVNLLQARNLIH